MTDPITYVFELETERGERIQWKGLTKAQAKAMYRYTEKLLPRNVKRFAWREA